MVQTRVDVQVLVVAVAVGKPTGHRALVPAQPSAATVPWRRCDHRTGTAPCCWTSWLLVWGVTNIGIQTTNTLSILPCSILGANSDIAPLVHPVPETRFLHVRERACQPKLPHHTTQTAGPLEGHLRVYRLFGYRDIHAPQQYIDQRPTKAPQPTQRRCQCIDRAYLTSF